MPTSLSKEVKDSFMSHSDIVHYNPLLAQSDFFNFLKSRQFMLDCAIEAWWRLELRSYGSIQRFQTLLVPLPSFHHLEKTLDINQTFVWSLTRAYIESDNLCCAHRSRHYHNLYDTCICHIGIFNIDVLMCFVGLIRTMT